MALLCGVRWGARPHRWALRPLNGTPPTQAPCPNQQLACSGLGKRADIWLYLALEQRFTAGETLPEKLLPAVFLPSKRDWGAGQGGIAGAGIRVMAGAARSARLRIPGCELKASPSPFPQDLRVCGQKPDGFGEPVPPVCRVRPRAAGVARYRPGQQAAAGAVGHGKGGHCGLAVPPRCWAASSPCAACRLRFTLIYTFGHVEISGKDFVLRWARTFFPSPPPLPKASKGSSARSRALRERGVKQAAALALPK